MTPSTARIAVFVLVSVALIIVALAVAPGGRDAVPTPATTRSALAAPDSGLLALAARRQPQLHKAATAFIAAYLRYEVGDLPAAVERSLRGLATTGFGRQLLGEPPRPGGPAGAARIVEVESGFLDRAVDRALVRGVARRPDGPEELAFIFVLREGRWLAAGAAE